MPVRQDYACANRRLRVHRCACARALRTRMPFNVGAGHAMPLPRFSMLYAALRSAQQRRPHAAHASILPRQPHSLRPRTNGSSGWCGAAPPTRYRRSDCTGETTPAVPNSATGWRDSGRTFGRTASDGAPPYAAPGRPHFRHYAAHRFGRTYPTPFAFRQEKRRHAADPCLKEQGVECVPGYRTHSTPLCF